MYPSYLTRYTTEELESMETISQGQMTDLKFEKGLLRYNLARTGLDAGEPYENAVYVEILDTNTGKWRDLLCYNGDDTTESISPPY